jgi:hypothetical protein
MKKLLLFLVLMVPTFIFAQSYKIDWYKIAGGGGTSSNGQYSISGTTGQPEGGVAMTGGNYSLNGGLWSPQRTLPRCAIARRAGVNRFCWEPMI